MVKNHTVRFRVSPKQLEQIKFYARAMGHQSSSAYLRYLALTGNSFTDERLITIGKDVKKILEVLQSGRRD